MQGSWIGPTILDHVRQAAQEQTRWSFPMYVDEELDLASEIDRADEAQEEEAADEIPPHRLNTGAARPRELWDTHQMETSAEP